MRSMNLLSAVLPTVLVLGTSAAQDPAPLAATASQIDAALVEFAKLSPRDQGRTLTEMKAAVAAIDHPLLKSIRACAGDATGLVRKAKLKSRTKRGKATHAGTGNYLDSLPFPVHLTYVFGFARTLDLPVPGKTRSQREAQLRRDAVDTLLHGYPLEIDRCLAVLESRLDHDRNADPLSRLFETWRNGSESFYHALDRTAGTQDSVFFYDAMLGDFTKQCIPKGHPDGVRLRKGLDAAHDALHKSFLAYRQYRAFREAVVLALLLPSDVALPACLARYDAQAGDHSMRERVALLLNSYDQDLEAVVSALTASAPPLPTALWTATYDPFPAFHALATKRTAAAGKTSTELLQAQTKTQHALQTAIREAAWSALQERIGSRSH